MRRAARNRARAKQKKARHSAAESLDQKRAEHPTGRTAKREPGGTDSRRQLRRRLESSMQESSTFESTKWPGESRNS